MSFGERVNSFLSALRVRSYAQPPRTQTERLDRQYDFMAAAAPPPVLIPPKHDQILVPPERLPPSSEADAPPPPPPIPDMVVAPTSAPEYLVVPDEKSPPNERIGFVNRWLNPQRLFGPEANFEQSINEITSLRRLRGRDFNQFPQHRLQEYLRNEILTFIAFNQGLDNGTIQLSEDLVHTFRHNTQSLFRLLNNLDLLNENDRNILIKQCHIPNSLLVKTPEIKEPLPNFVGWQRFQRANGNRKLENKVIKREIQQYLHRNQTRNEFLGEDELFELNTANQDIYLYNQEANKFFQQLDREGRLNTNQREVLIRFGVLPQPELKSNKKDADHFSSIQSDPQDLIEIVKTGRSYIIKRAILKDEERLTKVLINELFGNRQPSEILSLWSTILSRQFPWDSRPPEHEQTLEENTERIAVFNLIRALETKRLGRNGHLSPTERLLANSAYDHILRTNKFANIFENQNYATATGGNAYVDLLRHLYSYGHKTQTEVDKESLEKLGRIFALMLVMLSFLQGTMDNQSLLGHLFQAVSLVTDSEAIKSALTKSPEFARQAGNAAVDWALNTVAPTEKYPYPLPIEELSIPPKKVAEKTRYKVVGEINLPPGTNGENIVGKFLVPENTPLTIQVNGKEYTLDTNQVSQSGGLVWKRNEDFVTMINGNIISLEKQTVTRHSADDKAPPLTIIIPATAPALPDEIEVTKTNGENKVLTQKVDFGDLNFKFAGYPSERIYFQQEAVGSQNYYVYFLDKDNQLKIIGYVDTINGLQIENDHSVPIPDQKGFYWKGTYAGGSTYRAEQGVLKPFPATTSDVTDPRTHRPVIAIKNRESPDFHPLFFLSGKAEEHIGLPTAILVQEKDTPVLAFADPKNPGYYYLGAGEINISTPATPLEMEMYGAKIAKLTKAGKTTEAQQQRVAFEKTHSKTIKVKDLFFTANGFAGYGVDKNGKGPTHYVEVQEGNVIGEAQKVIVTAQADLSIPGTLSRVTSITFNVPNPFGVTPENLFQPSFNKLLPTEITFMGGEVAYAVPGHPGLYQNKNNQMFQVTGTGEKLSVSIHTGHPAITQKIH